MRKLLFFIFLLIASSAFAQESSDEQLAAQFFQNKEYDKALVYYEKLFNKKPSNLLYKNHLACLYETKNFDKAEKLIKKQIKQNPESAQYKIDLGVFYRQKGDANKAKEIFERSIKDLYPSQEHIFDLAKAFMGIKEWDYAITTYKRGQRMMGDIYSFNFELADVYAAKGDISAMINEYLDMLEVSEGYIQNVQNALQIKVTGEEDSKKNELIKGELLKRIQKSSDNTIFSELLTWLFIQQKDFEGAFSQAKALDKRKGEDGSRIVNLAQVAVSNGNYDVAIKAYEYVITKGAKGSYYVNSKMELLSVMYRRIIEQNNYKQEDLLLLEKNYISTLTELGKYAGTAPLIKNLAHLQAFYLYKNEEAIKILKEAIALPQLSTAAQAECKLELGDIMLMTGDIWEASLIYSQVEKAFKYDAIGQEAKFRNAKISYYTGDFKWSQAQLDVLKGATAKLIANDAMELSLVITDNTGIDTNAAPLFLFAKADLLAFQNKDEESMKKLDSITTLYPSHMLADDILMKKAQIMLKQGKYTEAAGFYEKVVTGFSYDILADDAMYKLAELNETRFNNKEKAMQLYQDILVKFPGSLYTVEARKKYRALRGDAVN